MLDFDLFTRVIDEAGPVARPHRLLQLRRSVPAQARRRDVRVHQGEVPAHLPLHEHQRPRAHRGEGRASSHSGIDEVTFSIDGSSQDTYVRYRQRGNFDKAMANLRAMVDEKRKHRPRRAVPELALHPLQLERPGRGDGARAADGRRDRRRSPLLGDHRPPRGRLLAAVRARHAGPRPHPLRGVGQQRPRQRDSRRHAARGDRRAHRVTGPAVPRPRGARRCRSRRA